MKNPFKKTTTSRREIFISSYHHIIISPYHHLTNVLAAKENLARDIQHFSRPTRILSCFAVTNILSRRFIFFVFFCFADTAALPHGRRPEFRGQHFSAIFFSAEIFFGRPSDGRPSDGRTAVGRTDGRPTAVRKFPSAFRASAKLISHSHV